MAKAYVCLAIDLVKRGRAGWLAVLERRLPIDYRANAVHFGRYLRDGRLLVYLRLSTRAIDLHTLLCLQ
jgi:hypothetical protein